MFDRKDTPVRLQLLPSRGRDVLRFLAVFLLLPGAFGHAQQFKLVMGSAEFTEYPKIRVPFEVLDNSATLDTLRPEDFMVFENGVRMLPVEIECGDLQGAQKIHFFFLMDVSYSMAFKEGTTQEDWRDSVKWRRAKTVFIESFNKLRPQDEGALGSFAGQFLLEQDWTTDKSALSDAAYGMSLRAGTSIYSAIASAVNMSAGKQGKRVIIILTDGVDNRSLHTREQAINLAWQAGIPVYPIGLGFYPDPTQPNRVDEDTLRRIANGTGGKAYFSPTSDELAGIFDDILKAIYSVNCVLKYTTPDTCQDGASRTVKVSANIHGTVLEHTFSYRLRDLRSRLHLYADVPPVLHARDSYAIPIVAEGEVRAGEPMSFRLRLDYHAEQMTFEGVETGPGILAAGDLVVTEATPGLVLVEGVRVVPLRGLGYGTPEPLITVRFRMHDQDSIALSRFELVADFAEQNCEIIPMASATDFTIHGCPAAVAIGFDTTLATVSGGLLRLPVTLTPGVDPRQTLEYSVTMDYDATLMQYIGIETESTVSALLSVTVDEQPGQLTITAAPGIPSGDHDVLFHLLFEAIETKSALPVRVELTAADIAQSAPGVVGYLCEPVVTLHGGRVFIDGVCEPLLRLRPRPTLDANSPNPVTGAAAHTRIRYTVSGLAAIQLEIIDQFGRRVALLDEGNREAGSYTATWIPADLPSGVYLCVLREGESIRTRKIVYTR
ncbi:MAG: VWA domain-containing protein [Bacteroidota bacterium]|jgi:hypothetical protein|nr:VWA domain-containing protein [Bacteroidota bacterium]